AHFESTGEKIGGRTGRGDFQPRRAAGQTHSRGRKNSRTGPARDQSGRTIEKRGGRGVEASAWGSATRGDSDTCAHAPSAFRAGDEKDGASAQSASGRAADRRDRRDAEIQSDRRGSSCHAFESSRD